MCLHKYKIQGKNSGPSKVEGGEPFFLNIDYISTSSPTAITLSYLFIFVHLEQLPAHFHCTCFCSVLPGLIDFSVLSVVAKIFSSCRKEISQYIDIPHNFTLTRDSVRIGQLMHYDYSSHKYVFSISENFRSLLPEVSPILNKHYNVCAVIGNSGILTGSRCGPQIEKYDFVFRCNFAPTEIFKKDVGRRTNMTTFNPSILEKYYNNLLTVQDRNNFFLSLKKLDGAILWIPAFFFHTSATVTRTLVDFFVEHRGQLKVQLAWPGNIMKYVNK